MPRTTKTYVQPAAMTLSGKAVEKREVTAVAIARDWVPVGGVGVWEESGALARGREGVRARKEGFSDAVSQTHA
jgi:hypothetical protein